MNPVYLGAIIAFFPLSLHVVFFSFCGSGRSRQLTQCEFFYALIYTDRISLIKVNWKMSEQPNFWEQLVLLRVSEIIPFPKQK
ncbi:hypothetical protein SAMN05421863_101849 [Nitrosomonas communis]|uniref:Uncharacterized protein n=1 Tax=Nitrosomonas communis TaxID=44574 RepID=A0A1I4P838_9PROT|nr:hypothetical protein SAMN05421863_101849 [Nitrosomonas communis]